MPYVTTVNMIFSQIQLNLVGCIFSYTRVKAGRLSPFLFLFVLDGLSALLKHEVDQNSITSIRVCRRVPGISHLLFADETLLFFKATENEAQRIKNAFNIY
jgi:hypothetical protein